MPAPQIVYTLPQKQQQAVGADRRALAGFLGAESENIMVWEPDGDSQCIFPYCSVLTPGWAGGRGRAERRFMHEKRS